MYEKIIPISNIRKRCQIKIAKGKKLKMKNKRQVEVL